MAVRFDVAFLDGLKEVGELKRIRSADRTGSIAQRLFLRAWSSLTGGDGVARVLADCAARAASAVRLGDLDLDKLAELGLPTQAALRILGEAAALAPQLPYRPVYDEPPSPGPLPRFARLLAEQPRAGVTCPGRARLILEPAEDHAEHCLMVALYGVALCEPFGADPARVWLAGLAHHLHNASMPDSGFTGETLLGTHLETLMAHAREQALAELDEPLRAAVRDALTILPDAGTPEGRAFHAADTLDRVWQIEQHLRAGRVELRALLSEMALVHEGPVKPFQDEILRAAGLC